ncbi:MAG: hypothetical protein MN733_35715 [Nitrososphaera sp.]|nr:hypothetical protein [Nitrososphaera sp.]
MKRIYKLDGSLLAECEEDDSAKIIGAGDGLMLGDELRLGEGVTIGEDVRIGNAVTLSDGVTIGGRVRIGDGAVFSEGVTVGRRAKIGGYAKLGIRVIIGERVWLGKLARIGAYSRIKDCVTLGNRVALGECVIIGENVTLGDDVFLTDYVTLGDYAALGDGIDSRSLSKDFLSLYMRSESHIFTKWVTKDRRSPNFDGGECIAYPIGGILEVKDAVASDRQCASGLHVLRYGHRPEWYGLCEADHDLMAIDVEVASADILFAGLPTMDAKLRVRKLKVLT